MKENRVRESLLSALAIGTVSGEESAQKLNVTRAAVWKQIGALRDDGYSIVGDARGYRLLEEGKRAYEVSLLRAFAGEGRRVICLPVTGSTNRDLRDLALAGAPAGTLVVSERQTEGRGRLGRSFASPAGGVYFSLLLRPNLPLPDAAAITGAVAVAAADALETLSGLPVGIKWVNDLYVHDKKIAGILCEAALNLESGTPDYVIAGIGINLSGELPPELAGIATSVEREGGTVPNRATLIAATVRGIERLAADPLAPSVIAESRRRSVLFGREVTVSRGNETFRALVTGITDRGELALKTPDGRETVLSSGEVSVHLARGEKP